jgi:hypothetical protein
MYKEILAGKVKLHGSMAQAKVQSFEPESIFSFIPLTFRAMPIATRIVTYGEVSTFITSIYMPTILPFCIVL